MVKRAAWKNYFDRKIRIAPREWFWILWLGRKQRASGDTFQPVTRNPRTRAAEMACRSRFA